MEKRRQPLNAPGPFCVSDGDCIACGAPEAEAPTLIASDDAGCYFKRQPATRKEVEQAIAAMAAACVQVHRYGGSDGRTLKRLAELDLAHCCDYSINDVPIVRNHVRSPSTRTTHAWSRSACSLTSWRALLAARTASFPVEGDTHRAQFEYEFDGIPTSLGYFVERVSPWRRTGTFSFQKTLSSKHHWLIVKDATRAGASVLGAFEGSCRRRRRIVLS